MPTIEKSKCPECGSAGKYHLFANSEIRGPVEFCKNEFHFVYHKGDFQFHSAVTATDNSVESFNHDFELKPIDFTIR